MNDNFLRSLFVLGFLAWLVVVFLILMRGLGWFSAGLLLSLLFVAAWGANLGR